MRPALARLLLAALLPLGAAAPALAFTLPGLPGSEQGNFDAAIAHVSRTAGMPAMVDQVAHGFLGRPYLADTLDAAATKADSEPLTARLDAFDCVTLVENSVAVARAVAIAAPKAPTLATYHHELERLRYRGGVRAGYASRMHYFSEWVADNERRGLVKDLTARLGGQPDARPISFMSAHRGSYRKLGDNRVFAEIQQVEASLSRTPRYVLPNARVAGILPLLQSGDVIAFATDIDGLDVVHTGLIDRQANGEVRLLHAPEPGQKVTISKSSLAEYLTRIPRHVGVLIVRPLPPAK